MTAGIRLGLWMLPSRILLRFVRNRAGGVRTLPGTTTTPSTAQIARAVQTVAGRIPHASCLTQALATQLLMARYGRTSELCFGVTREETGSFAAHAWVEIGGSVVLGGPIDRYVRMPNVDKALFSDRRMS